MCDGGQWEKRVSRGEWHFWGIAIYHCCRDTPAQQPDRHAHSPSLLITLLYYTWRSFLPLICYFWSDSFMKEKREIERERDTHLDRHRQYSFLISKEWVWLRHERSADWNILLSPAAHSLSWKGDSQSLQRGGEGAGSVLQGSRRPDLRCSLNSTGMPS